MKTSKSLDEILEAHYLWAVKNVEHGIYIPLPSPETEAAIVEAVEGLAKAHTKMLDHCTDDMVIYSDDFLQAIKEWQ